DQNRRKSEDQRPNDKTSAGSPERDPAVAIGRRVPPNARRPCGGLEDQKMRRSDDQRPDDKTSAGSPERDPAVSIGRRVPPNARRPCGGLVRSDQQPTSSESDSRGKGIFIF